MSIAEEESGTTTPGDEEEAVVVVGVVPPSPTPSSRRIPSSSRPCQNIQNYDRPFRTEDVGETLLDFHHQDWETTIRRGRGRGQPDG